MLESLYRSDHLETPTPRPEFVPDRGKGPVSDGPADVLLDMKFDPGALSVRDLADALASTILRMSAVRRELGQPALIPVSVSVTMKQAEPLTAYEQDLLRPFWAMLRLRGPFQCAEEVRQLFQPSVLGTIFPRVPAPGEDYYARLAAAIIRTRTHCDF